MWDQTSLEPDDPHVEQALRYLRWGPRTWRGALIVSMAHARPIAIAHLPDSTIWPFTMAVSFVVIFVAALIDSLPLFGVGAFLAAVAGIRWFWPSDTEAAAIQELGTKPRSGNLPLAIAGPISNGWWATMVVVLVLAVTLATLVSSYFYLASSWTTPDPPDLSASILAVGAALLLAPAALVMWGATRARLDSVGKRRLALALSFLLNLAVLGVLALLHGYHQTSHTSHTHAQYSMFLLLILFQGIVVSIVMLMSASAQLWAWLAPADERGLAVSMNAAPLSYFAAGSWLVIVTTVYLLPWLA